MPWAPAFHHQQYRATAPTSPHHLLAAEPSPPLGSVEWRQRLQAVGRAYRAAGVGVVLLAHGTFVGHDAMGALQEVQRFIPSAAAGLRRLSSQLMQRMTGEAGNYTPEFATLFAEEIGLPVRLFEWSSENNHIGRADGAVRLIHELASLELPRGQRVLLWGHSHAGNVFALVSQLLGGDREAVDRFFEATAIYYQWPLLGCVDIPLWRAVQRMFDRPYHPLRERPLDVVTFGTPLQYGWNPYGFSQLLHFVYHRPVDGLPEYRAPFPPQVDRVLVAADGDYVQQLGIAGTNFAPSIFAWRARWAETRLAHLLQADIDAESLYDRLRAGARVSEEGTTLLVDYGLPGGSLAEHHAGHALYTRRQWLLFHAEQVARRFYSRPS